MSEVVGPPARDVAMSPTGSWFALSTSDGTVVATKSDSGESHRHASPHNEPRRLQWSPNGRYLLAVDETSVALHDVERQFAMRALAMPPGWKVGNLFIDPLGVSWDPRGDRVALYTTTNMGTQVALYRLDNGQSLGVFEEPQLGLAALHWHPHDPKVVVADRGAWVHGNLGYHVGKIGVWRIDTLERDAIDAHSMTLSPNGTWASFVVGFWREKPGAMFSLIRDVQSMKVHAKVAGQVVRWSPTGTWVASVITPPRSDNRWDHQSLVTWSPHGSRRHTLAENFSSLLWLDDRHVGVVKQDGDRGAMAVIDADTGEQVATLPLPHTAPQSTLDGAAVELDLRDSTDREIMAWRTGETLRLRAWEQDQVVHLSITDDHGGYEGSLPLEDVGDGMKHRPGLLAAFVARASKR